MKLFIFFGLLFLLGNYFETGSCDDGESDEEENLDTVTVEQGGLQGTRFTSRRNRTYYGFLGVPFGKVGERFANAEKADSWDGVKAVKTLPPPCFQYFSFTHQMVGVEDCLQLNVYSPKPKRGEQMPVMFFISPGGFQMGGASHFEAEYIMDQDVVFVSINFRMGALGFLNSGDGTVTGNMGLRDQVLALEWVKKNIKNFGGDSTKVTIWGLSAGGAAVDYLTISPMAKGLFHRAIAMSGSSLNPWAFQPHATEIAEQLATNAGCGDHPNWPEKVKCLRQKVPSEVVNAQLKLMKHGFDFEFLPMKFVPSVESDKVQGPRFLSDTPYNLLSKGEIVSKVPYMTGHVENEGAFFVATIVNSEKLMKELDTKWISMTPPLFFFDDLVTPTLQGGVSKAIRDFYLGGRPFDQATRKGFTDIYSDRLFNNGIAKGIQLRADHQPVYSYLVDYQGQHSLIQFDFGVKDRDGVGHADDLMYLFNKTFAGPDILLGTKDGEFSEKLLSLFVSFAKDGKPTSLWGNQQEWPTQEHNKPGKLSPVKLYKLDLEQTELLSDPWAPRRKFWDTLPIKEHEKVGMDDPKEEL